MSLTAEWNYREGCLAGLLRAKEVLEGKVDEPVMALLVEEINKEKSTPLYEDWIGCEEGGDFEESDDYPEEDVDSDDHPDEAE